MSDERMSKFPALVRRTKGGQENLRRSGKQKEVRKTKRGKPKKVKKTEGGQKNQRRSGKHKEAWYV